jgi:hypothetical protein
MYIHTDQTPKHMHTNTTDSKKNAYNKTLNNPSIINALRNHLSPSELAKLRKTSPRLMNLIPRKEATTKVKLNLDSNTKRLKLLSNRVHVDRNKKYANLSDTDMINVLMKESGIFRAGMEPNRNVGENYYNNLWTKENWVVWHAINMYVNYVCIGKRMSHFNMNKAISRLNNTTNQVRIDKLETKLWNMKENEKELKLMDFIEFYSLFTKSNLQAL